MAAALTYRAVHVDEIPSGGARPITVAPTSIAALVGSLPQGSTDVMDITSLDDFVANFGAGGEDPLGVAVDQYFLNGGFLAKVVRALPAVGADGTGGATRATLTLGVAVPPPLAGRLLRRLPLRLHRQFWAKTAGAWGNQLRARNDLTAAQATTTYALTIHDPRWRQSASGAKPDDQQHRGPRVAAEHRSDVERLEARDGRACGNARPADSHAPEKDGQNVFGDATKAKATVPPDPNAPPVYFAADKTSGSDGAAGAALNYEDAFSSLRKTDTWSLLCVQPATHGTDIPDAVLAGGARFCQGRRAFFIVDPPAAWSGAEIADARDIRLELSSPPLRSLTTKKLDLQVPDAALAPDVAGVAA